MNDQDRSRPRDHETDHDIASTSTIASGMAILDRCLVDGDPAVRSSEWRRRRKTFGASLGLEILAVGVLVSAPLLTTVAKPHDLRVSSAGPVFSSGWRSHTQPRPSRPQTAASPRPIVRDIFNLALNPHAPAMSDPAPTLGPDPGGLDNLDGSSKGPIEIIESVKPALMVEPPRVDKPAAEKHPVKMSEGVVQAQLISRIEPRYPSLAVQIHLEGAVRLHAIIDRDGRIASLEMISGHPLLVQAALEAVRQWRYRPTMLNGEPVEVETSITVNFHLAGR